MHDCLASHITYMCLADPFLFGSVEASLQCHLLAPCHSLTVLNVSCDILQNFPVLYCTPTYPTARTLSPTVQYDTTAYSYMYISASNFSSTYSTVRNIHSTRSSTVPVPSSHMYCGYVVCTDKWRQNVHTHTQFFSSNVFGILVCHSIDRFSCLQ